MKGITGNNCYDNINEFFRRVAMAETGIVDKFADDMQCSGNTIKNYKHYGNEILEFTGINRDTNAYILHDRKNNTYYYSVPGRLIIGQWALWLNDPCHNIIMPKILILKERDKSFVLYRPSGELFLY